MEDVEYLLIFDYYDYPLSFISKKIEGIYYFFYFIDYSTFFIKPLSIKDLSLIFSGSSVKEILEEFEKASDFEIIQYISSKEEPNIKSIAEYEKENSISIVEFFPEGDLYFEKDSISKLSFQKLKVIYPEFFPDFFKNKSL